MRDGRWTGVVEGLLISVVISLVAAFFLTGMMGGKAPDEAPAVAPSTQTSRKPVGDVKPGVPSVPVDKHETWPDEPGIKINPDRQLDQTQSSAALPKGLGKDLKAYWEQPLAWEPCDDQLCAKVKVPLDWDKPAEAALEIAMRKVPAANPERGPLFVNPGGPGMGGQDFAVSLGKDAFKGYDLIGWDPRGTGESTQVKCGSADETDKLFGLDSSPDDEAEKRALEEGWTEFAKTCRKNSGALLDHLTTIEVARDLDLLRYLTGADKLNYLGVSYGTYVGAMYAELFPDRAGRLVLDSAVDITDGEDSISQAEGFELALRNYAKWCGSNSRCPLGDETDQVVTKVSEFLKGLDAKPLKVGDRELTQSLATNGIALFLYASEEAYPSLTYILQDAMDGRAQGLLAASDSMNGRQGGGYQTLAYAFPAMRCADWADGGVEDAYAEWAEASRKSPVFAANAGLDLACQKWTATSAPFIKITAKGAPEILVVGTTGDSATPYQQAETMAKQLDKGVLLTLEGAGHGAVTSGNECIRATVDEYFLSGKLPPDGKRCKN